MSDASPRFLLGLWNRCATRSVAYSYGSDLLTDPRHRRGYEAMIVYNELVAVTAGVGLIGFAWFLAQLVKGKPINSEGWAGLFGVTGLLLLVTGLHTTLTWPFGA